MQVGLVEVAPAVAQVLDGEVALFRQEEQALLCGELLAGVLPVLRQRVDEALVGIYHLLDDRGLELLPALLVGVHAEIIVTLAGHGGEEHLRGALALGLLLRPVHRQRRIQHQVGGLQAVDFILRLHQLLFCSRLKKIPGGTEKK